MWKMILLIALVLLSVPLYAQQDPDDPGIQDSIIVGSVRVDSGAIFANIPLYFVTDDSLYFFNCPLTWHSPQGGVRPGSGSLYFPPLTCWDYYDTVLTAPNLIRLVGWDIDDCWPIFSNGLRQHVWTLRFIIEPGARPQVVTIDSCFDPRNGSVIFGLWDGMTEITPAVLPGSITIGQPVGVDEHDSGLPQEFSLSQNYPNPFNPSTNITFTLPSEGQASLVVYDLLGREVRTLLDERLGADSYSLVWDGRDNTGQDVPSGTYFYRLLANGQEETKRMVLLR